MKLRSLITPLALFIVIAANTAAREDAGRGLRRDLSILESFGFSGAVLVEERHHTILAQGYGAAGEDPKDRITTHTAFDIGSLAKQFTAAAIMLLESERKLQVSDTVGRFFPDAPSTISPITIHQLLTHSSGLPGGNVTTEETTELDPLTRDAAVGHILGRKLRFAPGSQYAYSNMGYVLLAAIVEKASGTTYRNFVRDRLWRAARLRDSRFWGESASSIALGKDELGVISDPRKYPAENWAIQGAGAILCSVSDLQLWFNALLDDRVLPKAAVERMFSPQGNSNVSEWRPGYGWRIGKIGADPGAVYHGGDWLGVGSQLIWQPKAQRLVILLVNIRNHYNEYPTRIKVQDVVLGSLDGTPVQLPQLKPPARTRRLKPGTYATSDGLRFRVRALNGSLSIGALNQPAVAFLTAPANTEAAAYREALTRRSAQVIEAVIRRDSAALKSALAASDDPPYVYEQLVAELGKLLRDRQVLEVTALGTYPATPTGLFWSVIELKTDRETLHYMLRWDPHGNVGSYHLRAPSEAAGLTVAPSGKGWIAWDIVRSESAIQIQPTTKRNQIELLSANRKVIAHLAAG